MNKTVPVALTLASLLTLSGCAGTTSDFECNATTSDTCMTIEQANEKAKRLEEASAVKPGATSLPRLAEGNFRTRSVQPLTLAAEPVHAIASRNTPLTGAPTLPARSRTQPHGRRSPRSRRLLCRRQGASPSWTRGRFASVKRRPGCGSRPISIRRTFITSRRGCFLL
jgi:conjugal transfer pilus assembly protein TraV